MRQINYSPDVGLGGEDALEEGFRRHPLDGQHGLAALAVIIGAGVDVNSIQLRLERPR